MSAVSWISRPTLTLFQEFLVSALNDGLEDASVMITASTSWALHAWIGYCCTRKGGYSQELHVACLGESKDMNRGITKGRV